MKQQILRSMEQPGVLFLPFLLAYRAGLMGCKAVSIHICKWLVKVQKHGNMVMHRALYTYHLQKVAIAGLPTYGWLTRPALS